SVASILASQAEADTASQDEAMSFFERGLDAEERGKTGVAKIYYRNALQTARGELRSEIEARLRALKYK
ncbi:MAG: hypothetical protein MI757_14540, partial [Pirellulales bacterium]|nr:hypothetical protein [Pirellulales bacterium]